MERYLFLVVVLSSATALSASPHLRSPKLLSELVELMGIEPMTS